MADEAKKIGLQRICKTKTNKTESGKAYKF